MTCRCPICGGKNADSNHNRSAYSRAGLHKDEHGHIIGARDKAHSRRLLRLREKREWQKEYA